MVGSAGFFTAVTAGERGSSWEIGCTLGVFGLVEVVVEVEEEGKPSSSSSSKNASGLLMLESIRV